LQQIYKMDLVQKQNQAINKDLYNEQYKKKKEAKREEIKTKNYYGNSKEYMKEWRLQNKRSPTAYISPSNSSSSAIKPTPS